MQEVERTQTGRVLAGVSAALDSLDPAGRGLCDEAERLALLELAVRVSNRLGGLVATLAREADQTDAATKAAGVGLVSWLALTLRLTRGEASRIVSDGRRLADTPLVRDAVLAGHANLHQAHAIGVALERLADLPEPDRGACEATLVRHASDFDSAGLARLGERVLEAVAPDLADAVLERQLEREHRQAQRHRHLGFTRDGHGSVRFHGSLPVVEAQQVIDIVDAIAHQAARESDHAADPVMVTPGQRRADALVELARHASLHRDAPAHGGDRPRLVITLDHDQLLHDAQGARLLTTGERLPASAVRHLLCDADLLPIVLNGHSVPLDVGRQQRLVTNELRAALAVRDGGCVMVGCDKPPQACHAHHILPWRWGGTTSLTNCVLVCDQHHPVVEPRHRPGEPPDPYQWHVRIADDDLPELIPPHDIDPTRTPTRHQRFRLRRAP